MAITDAVLWAFVAVLFVLGLALVASRWPVWAKGLLVAGVTALYFWSDAALEGVWGWPSRHALPERFVLLAAVFDEPAKGREGALYVWVNAIENGKPSEQPRAYRLPYSKDLHALLGESMKKVRQGVSQLGQAEPRRGPKGLSWLRPGSDEQVVKIRDLPAPQLPEK
ncbi:hypothetical protein [Sphaerotilus uruguayifluvii]|uniref:Uncharacterized protein n=1 Tax=Sphaerotilus uruguayifluvii TaxID=2735897 RepID=A0ABX2G761_9BURK|nr:hypothetical protein [Leptothrix sp. C29]NRT57230.1 hypothetical protein [Leptothrix sp. C29]